MTITCQLTAPDLTLILSALEFLSDANVEMMEDFEDDHPDYLGLCAEEATVRRIIGYLQTVEDICRGQCRPLFSDN
jgi:hypothetical protein